jgi:hypothetical protein
MLVLAALGADGGRGAVRSIASWAIDQGRRPGVLDLCCEDFSEADTPPTKGACTVPRASIPEGVEKFRAEPPEARAAVMEQLRRYESASDLLIVRIPPRHRIALMQAAFLTGGLVLPIDGSDEALCEAQILSRQVSECFDGVAVWPFLCAREELDRFRAMARDFQALDVQPLDVEDPAAVAILGLLSPPPEEGFLAALLALPGSPAAELVRLDDLRL